MIDISDPAHPWTVYSSYTSSEAKALHVSGNLVLVAGDSTGLSIVQMIDPVTEVTVLDSNTIKAILPFGLAPGPYHIVLTYPGGVETILHNAFKVQLIQ